eukprot:gene7269-8042_t
MESGNKILDAARIRAQSRANILQSLQQSFGQSTTPGKTAPVKKNEEVVVSDKKRKLSGETTPMMKKSKSMDEQAPSSSSSSSFSTSAVKTEPSSTQTQSNTAGQSFKAMMYRSVEALLNLMGESSDRSREHYRDCLQSKALILDNVKTQLRANKALTKIQRREKQQQRLSNRQMKKRGLTPHFVDYDAIFDYDYLSSIHTMWWRYALAVITGSKGDSQLEARLESLELVGAKVSIHQSTRAVLVGVEAVVIAHSGHTLHLLHNRSQPTKPNTNNSNNCGEGEGRREDVHVAKKKKKVNQEYLKTHKVIKVDQREVVLAIQIPAKGSSVTSSVVVNSENEGGEGKNRHLVDRIGVSLSGGQARIMLLYGKHFLPTTQSSETK